MIGVVYMGLIGRVAMVGLLAHHDWPFMKEASYGGKANVLTARRKPCVGRLIGVVYMGLIGRVAILGLLGTS